MFTVEQIKAAHSKVKSGADFPAYVQEIKQLGVTAFETWVIDITDNSDKEKFNHYLHIHQQGKTDYFTFCRDCAKTGIEKWFVCLDAMTCTYYDKAGKEILVEQIPG
jgi:uncharacterized protein YbcV (DUF1398 family)